MIESKFKERNIVEKPACPFCTRPLERPAGTGSVMPVGSCACGAVYVCDVTGHNLGSALVDALLGVCKGDSDKAWSLTPEQDYFEKQVRNYDLETHQIIHGGVYQGRRIAGALLFVQLKQAGEKSSPAAAPPGIQAQEEAKPTTQEAKQRSLSKEEVAALVASYDLGPLVAYAPTDKRVVRNIKRLLYSPDELLRLRAAEALGRVSDVLFCTDPGAVSRLLQELFSSVTDTAASAWGAIDAIGEIIRFRPGPFESFIPRLAQLSRDPSLIESVLRALATIAKGSPDSLCLNATHLIRLLEDQNPTIRGYAVVLIGLLKIGEAKGPLENLKGNPLEIDLHRDGMRQKKALGSLAEEALNRL